MRFPFIKAHLVLLILLLPAGTAIAQTEQQGGLKFFNKINITGTNNTSLNLTPNNPISFDQNFTLQFDCSIWDTSHFGLITYIFNSDDFYIALLYSQHEKVSKSVLILSINGDSLYTLNNYNIGGMIYPNWAKISIQITAVDGTVKLLINNSTIILQKIPTPNFNALNIRYGYLMPENLFPIGLNLPDMLIKNIKVSLDDRDKYFWPLDEIEGNIALDTINGEKAIQQYGQWKSNENIYWKALDSIEFNEKPAVAYDSSKEILYFVTQKYLWEYSLSDKKNKRINYANNHPEKADKILFNQVNNKLMSYYRGGEGEISVFDSESKKWSKINSEKDTHQNFYYHTAFVDPLNGDVLTLGGYGFYSAKNNLRKYDFTDKTWYEVKKSGDVITPRSGAAIGYGKEPWEIYVFSGFGNKSGKQSMGFNEQKDLFRLDLRNHSFKKLWAGENTKINTFSNFSEMILDTSINVLYSLSYDSLFTETQSLKSKLYFISITDTIIKEVSEYLPAGSNAMLAYDKKEKRFIAILLNKEREKTYAMIYSLDYPPLSYDDALNIQQSRIKKFSSPEISNAFIIIISSIVVLLLIMTWLFRRKYHKRSAVNVSEPKGLNIKLFYNNHNLFDVRLFGNFMILSSDKEDISKKLTPKLCELFLLVSVYTLLPPQHHRSNGISTEEMTNLLWPDNSIVSAKNIRGVSLHHIREILNCSTGLNIVYKDKLWRLSVTEKIKIDVISYLDFKNNFNSHNYNREDIISFIRIFKHGGLLPEKCFQWLDQIKMNVDAESIALLSNLYLQKADSGDNELLLSIADVILKIDPVNETGLMYKLSALSSLGEQSLIQKTYEQFAEEYKRLYDEQYPKSLSEIV